MGLEEGVCYTYEAALEKAIEMEEEGFRSYLHAIRIVNDRAAKLILRDAAADELQHKQQLELALLDGYNKNSAEMVKEVPTMNLDYVLEQKEISPKADGRQALAYAIHLEKGAIDFYQRLMKGCEGAPMAPVFKRLLGDETRHLKTLEDLYECHFMTEN